MAAGPVNGRRHLSPVALPEHGTPIQRATWHLAAAVAAAREDERADAAFADVLAIVAARENARHLERARRAA